MTEKELSKKLAEMYFTARKKEMATMIHLFGIKYSQELQGKSLKEILRMAEMRSSYQTEIRKGMNLAKYVELKK